MADDRERNCPQCGSPVKPAMLRCFECGERMVRGETKPEAPVQHSQSRPAARVVGRSQHAQRRAAASSAASTYVRPSLPVAAPEPIAIGPEPKVVTSPHIIGARPLPVAASVAPRRSVGAVPLASSEETTAQPDAKPSKLKKSRSRRSDTGIEPQNVRPIHDQAALEQLRQVVDAELRNVETDSRSAKGKRTLSGRRFRTLKKSLVIENSLSGVEAERRRKAIIEFGTSQDSRFLEFVAPYANDSWERVRQAVAKAAGECGDPALLRILLEMLFDRDDGVVSEAVQGLRTLADPRAIRPLMVLASTSQAVKLQATEAIVQMGPASIPRLKELAVENDESIRQTALVILGRIGDAAAVSVVLSGLECASADVRATAVEALGRIGERETAGRIIRMLNDPHPVVRLHTVIALQKIPDLRALRPLHEILQSDSPPELRRHVVIALGATKDPRAVSEIALQIRDADPAMLYAIAGALSICADMTAIRPLEQLLGCADSRVQIKAINGLRRTSCSRAAKLILPFLNDANPALRRHAVDAIGDLDPVAEIDLVTDLLVNDVSCEVRAAAARALGRTGDRRVVPALESALRDQSSVRCAAVIGLTSLGLPDAVPPLLAMLRDPAPEVRYHAVSGLGKLQADTAGTAIKAMVEDPDSMVKAGAEKTLKQLGIEQVRMPLWRRAASVAAGGLPDAVAAIIPRSALAVVAVLATTAAIGMWPLVQSVSSAGTSAILSRGLVTALDFDQTGETLLVTRRSGSAEVWNDRGELIQEIALPGARSGSFNKNGTPVLILSDRASIWNFRESTNLAVNASWEISDTYWMAYSQNRDFFVLATARGDFEVRDSASGKIRSQVTTPRPSTFAISNDGYRLLFMNDMQTLHSHDLQTGDSFELKIGQEDERPPLCMAAYDQGRLVAIVARGEERGTARVIVADVQQDKFRLTLDEIVRPIPSHVQFNSSGSALFYAATSEVGRLPIDGGAKESWSVDESDSSIDAMAINDSGSIIAVADDESVNVWLIDTDSGNITTLSPPPAR